MPPWGWWPCAFVGLAIFERLLANEPAKTRFVRGWLVGLSWLFPATLWMWDLTPPGYLIQGVLYAVMYGLAAMLVPPGRGRRIAFPALFVLVALVRWNWPFGGVPLATLAMTQADGPLLPTARLFTSLTIVALVPIVAMALGAAIRREWKPVGICLGIVAGVWLLALVAPSGQVIDTREIAIVQGGGPQNTRAITSDARKVFERHAAATDGVEGQVDFVFWPENAITTWGAFADSQEYVEISELARRLDAPMIVGIFESYRASMLEEGIAPPADLLADLAPAESGRGFNLNAQVTVMPDGTILDRYDKLRLVPFGETVPLRWLIEPFAPAALPSRDARAGAAPAVLDTGTGATAAVSISWEIFHDDRAHDGMRNGGEILLNPTNGASYWLTILQTQQIASSQLRATETGRYVLQAAPTGFSAIVEPDGTVIDRSGVSEAKVIQGTVELRTGKTWSVALGWWPALIGALVAFVAAWQRARTPDEAGD